MLNSIDILNIPIGILYKALVLMCSGFIGLIFLGFIGMFLITFGKLLKILSSKNQNKLEKVCLTLITVLYFYLSIWILTVGFGLLNL